MATVGPKTPRLRQDAAGVEVSFLPLDRIWADERFDATWVTEFSGDLESYNPVAEGDLLVPKVAPTFSHGRVARARGLTNGLALATSEVFVLRPHESTTMSFLQYRLLAADFRTEGEASLEGVAGLKRISADFLRNVRIDREAWGRQGAIARFLDREREQIGKVDARLNEALTLQRSYLVARRSELMRALPEEVATRYVADCLDGRRIPLNAEARERRAGPYPYWGANSIQGYVDDYLFDETLVLLGEDGAPFFDDHRDVAWVVAGKVWVNNHAHILRVRSAWSPHFVAEALNAVDYGRYITGATRDKLTQASMDMILLPAPSLSEQQRIATEVAELKRRTAAVAERIAMCRERLAEYRDALITEAVTGQLDVSRLSDSQLDESAHAAMEGERPEVLSP